MQNMIIDYIGLHNRAEHIYGVCPCSSINFAFAGVEYRKIYQHELHFPPPMFVIGLRGAPFDTKFNAERHNWRVAFHGIRLRPDPATPDHAIIEWDGIQLSLPLLVPVAESEVPFWKNEFIRLKYLFDHPTKKNLFLINLYIMNIFRFLLSYESQSTRELPEEKFKHLIDADVNFSQSLEQFASQCGYSVDHLRILFRKRYQINPWEYRNRKRMAAATELIANSNLLVKEIAAQVGFASETAFTAMYRRTNGHSPRKAIKLLRENTG